jgi:hypothetical protein
MNARMNQTLTALQSAYQRQADRLAVLRAARRPAKIPTVDELAGMAWWNSLTEQRRAYWCRVAQTATPKLAWDYFKLCREIERETRQ